MRELSCATAGESHGACLITLVEGLPAGFRIPLERVDSMLAMRQGGYGRGGRQSIETDRAELLSGVLRGKTIGSPVALRINNRDHRIDEAPPVHRPRPGHADLAGAWKWGTTDCRPVLERASARETAARTAAGAIARGLLAEFGVEAVGFVTGIGAARADIPGDLSPEEITKLRDASEVYCPASGAEEPMKAEIDAAREDGDTVGGIIEVRVTGLPRGLGSCARWEDRLDARLAGAVMGIQAVKGVEVGAGFGVAERRGSEVHDEILPDSSSPGGILRPTNRAGGLEGGMTNGEPVIVRAAMKPISTLARRLRSVDLVTMEAVESAFERSDICAVPALSVIAEAVVCFELARAFLAKFGGDTMAETTARFAALTPPA
ncbi:MAG: chorismate synthase [Gemmatimonadota bacterium]|jgi:chorismate synthase|nr:chorismate synthase [Gemmatimonadota bacterium]MDP6460919.1 chorismate synthase [Gemmatimonadota bacterium]MDP6530111.1 chorismate synthase [Gemmatimonadota bacterium]MDP6801961.1 chorismate synthase [Gemmatimonadota bacterium]MDP7031309.1 chorismate synthase [Gemmatimonadota bacterium]